MKKTRVLFFAMLFTGTLFCQSFRVSKVEPGNWWAGMKMNKIQLMIYGENLDGYKASFNTPKIKIEKIYVLDNKDYSFIDISISQDVVPGDYKLNFSKGTKNVQLDFPILKRANSAGRYQGFNSTDVIYLIVPDRFADGDTTNNKVEGMINDFKQGDPLARHGGDLQGIINHLNYFSDLGVTALWLTPVLENNHNISYHGYAATNLYKVDPRFGSNDRYREFVNKAHEAGLKVIFDHVSNHISTNHPWVKNLPTPDWLNGTQENHMNTWHDKAVRWDIHGEEITDEHLTKGWFVNDMADINQDNPFVKSYLIENTIWWIEYAGIDGIREDTYPYVSPTFTSVWAKEILNEYPSFNIVGEVWTGVPAFIAPYQKDSKLNKGLNTNLPVVTDFALRDAYDAYLSGRSNLYNVYNILAQDYLYQNANNLLTFVDNHDVPRAMFEADGNAQKVKLVFAHLLTSRGIPEIFYGTEIGIKGNREDGRIRTNFRGGFPGDSSDAFEASGRTKNENDLFLFIKKLLEIRKKYKSLSEGKLNHLAPIGNVYIYTKKYKNETMLILLNGDDSTKEIDGNIIESVCGKTPKFFDVMNDTRPEIINGKLPLKPMSANIFLIE